ncbi:MAG: AMP-binding protein [Sulfobacillus sp.]
MEHDLTIAGHPIAWRPDPARLSSIRLLRMLRRMGLPDLESLNQLAATDPAQFWQEAVIKEIGLIFRQAPDQWVDRSEGVPWTRYMVGAKLNLWDSMLEQHTHLRPADPAVIWEGENGEVALQSWMSLQAEVDRFRAGLRQAEIQAGDRVGVFMPMLPETIVAVLGVAAEGAVLVPIFSGYGAAAVASRLQDATVRLLITADGFLRRGKAVSMLETARQAVANCPSIQHVVVKRRLGQIDLMANETDWLDFVAHPAAPRPDALDSQAPLMVIYTSGTTGRPKGALHVQSGFPVKAAQDLAHAFDLNLGDRLFWLTDLGWMMGPWAIYGTLMLGATLVIYEGTPDHPAPDRLWQLVERHRVTHLGVAPTVIRSLMGHGPELPARHDLSSLRILGATGEAWNVEPWYFFLEAVGGRRCPIINYSGGTEISGGILASYPHLPQKPCAFNGPLPGMAAMVIDDKGERRVGEVGELAIGAPWVGMTRGFWQDNQRYLDTYWSRHPDTWVHGDFALETADGFWYILGRSDDTIKVAGKRLGPAEAESAAVSHPAVAEALAIEVPDEVKGGALVVFCVLRPGHDPLEPLRQEIHATIVTTLGKALAPKKVLFCAELPHTRNGKMLRRLARAAYLSLAPGDLSALENPDSMTAIRQSW